MPNHIRAGAEITRNLAVIAAHGAADSNGVDLRAELADLARALHAVTRSSRGEFSVQPVRPRVLELQLQDLHVSAKLALATRHDFGTADATRLARRLPDLVDALASRTHAQISNLRWAMPDRRENVVLPYAFASTNEPGLTSALMAPLTESTASAASLRERFTETEPLSPLAVRLSLLNVRPDSRRARHPSVGPAATAGTARGASPSR